MCMQTRRKKKIPVHLCVLPKVVWYFSPPELNAALKSLGASSTESVGLLEHSAQEFISVLSQGASHEAVGVFVHLKAICISHRNCSRLLQPHFRYLCSTNPFWLDSEVHHTPQALNSPSTTLVTSGLFFYPSPPEKFPLSVTQGFESRKRIILTVVDHSSAL